MNKLVNFSFFILLLSTAVITVKVQSKSSLMAEAETNLSNRIYVTVDNVLDAIVVGSTSVNLAGVWGTTNWTQVSSINVAIHDGDTITIAGHNISGSKGILACFHYRDSFGSDHEVCTGKEWTCNGQSPVDFGQNGVYPWGSKPYVNLTARWIWSADNSQYVKCSYKIKPRNNIFITVDNELTNLSIGGVSLDLTPAIYYNDWNKVDQLFYVIKEGDIISITGKNYPSMPIIKNPAAMIASFHYLNRWGIHKVINTNQRWYCNKRGAYSWGLNGVSPWGFKAPIEPAAEWIWSQNLSDQYSTCFYKVPVTKFPPNIFINTSSSLSAVKVNGQAVNTGEDVTSSIDSKTKALSYQLNEGDILEITSNISADINNPNTIAASIHYIDTEGKVNVLSTCSNWTCNGKKALSLGVNGDENFGTIKELQPDAKFITSDNAISVEMAQITCKIQLPIIKPNIPPNVFFTADDSFTSLRLNGIEADLSGSDYLNDSTKADSLALNIQPGDLIELTAEKDFLSKLGGILASFHYIDVNGKPAILNTSGNWTCNKLPAKDQALNGEAPFPAIESIEPDASWIWFDDKPIIVEPPIPIDQPTTPKIPAVVGFIQIKQDASIATPPIIIGPPILPPNFKVTCSIIVPKKVLEFPDIEAKDC